MDSDTQDQAELRAMLRLVGLNRHGERWKIRMAEELGCARSTVTLWDNGQRRIVGMAARSVRRLARAERIKKSDIEAQILVDSANNQV